MSAASSLGDMSSRPATSQITEARPLPSIFHGGVGPAWELRGAQTHRGAPPRPFTVHAPDVRAALTPAPRRLGGVPVDRVAGNPSVGTKRQVEMRVGKRIQPTPIPQWTTDEAVFRQCKDLGVRVFGENYAAQYRGAAGVQSGWPESLPVGPRNYKNPQRSVIDPLVFNKDVPCTRDALMGSRTFHSDAAGIQAISSQPVQPKPPRATYGEGGPLNPHAPERRHGGWPAGKTSQDLVVAKLQKWEC